MRRAVRLVVAGVLFLGVLCVASPEAPAEATLPPEAEQAVQYGLAAAKQQEWQLAIRYFGEAREAAPYAPEVLLNLALANDKAGGRELLAIAWFRAFLAAAPGAANAGQVRERIVELEVKVEANAAKLIGKAKEAAAQLPERYRRWAIVNIAEAQAKAGDIAGARESIALAQSAAARISYDFDKSAAYADIAKAQAEAGDAAGARASIALARAVAARLPYAGTVIEGLLVSSIGGQSDAYVYIAEAQAEMGDIAGARETAARVSDDADKSSAYAAIAWWQAKAGDIAGARETAEEKEIAAEPYVRDEEIDAWTEMVEYQLNKPLFQDIQGFIRSLTAQEAGVMVNALADAAAELAEAMRNLQEKDAEWRERWAEAQ